MKKPLDNTFSLFWSRKEFVIVKIFPLNFHVFVCAFHPEISSFFFFTYLLCMPNHINILSDMSINIKMKNCAKQPAKLQNSLLSEHTSYVVKPFVLFLVIHLSDGDVELGSSFVLFFIRVGCWHWVLPSPCLALHLTLTLLHHNTTHTHLLIFSLTYRYKSSCNVACWSRAEIENQPHSCFFLSLVIQGPNAKIAEWGLENILLF